jgi:hypothetical protein
MCRAGWRRSVARKAGVPHHRRSTSQTARQPPAAPLIYSVGNERPAKTDCAGRNTPSLSRAPSFRERYRAVDACAVLQVCADNVDEQSRYV